MRSQQVLGYNYTAISLYEILMEPSICVKISWQLRNNAIMLSTISLCIYYIYIYRIDTYVLHIYTLYKEPYYITIEK